MLAGATYNAALTQAETELESALQIGGVDPGVLGAQMSFLAGDTLPSAYLFSMSSVFDREAKRIAGSATSLQEQINIVESELAADGGVDGNTLALLRRAQVCVRPSDVMGKLQQRFTTIASSAIVPNINRALNSDLDDPNLTDTCLRAANPTQAQVDDQVCSSSIDTTAPAATTMFALQLVRTGNLNGDGRADVIAIGAGQQVGGTTPQPEVLTTWLGLADGGYAAPSTASLLALASAPYQLTPLEARTWERLRRQQARPHHQLHAHRQHVQLERAPARLPAG